MKTLLKLYLLLLLPLTFIFGQNLKGLEIKSGLVTSSQNWEYSEIDVDRYDINFYGFYFGMAYDIINSKFFSSNFEVAYIQKGAAEEIHITTLSNNEQGYIDKGTKTFRNRLDYLSLAIYGNLKYETDFLTPYLLLGPRFDMQINRHIELADLSNEFKKYIYGFSLGGGILIHSFVRHDLVLEITSSPNVNNLYKTELLKVSNYSYEVKLGIKLK